MFRGEIGPQQNRDSAILGVKINRVLEVLRRRSGCRTRNRGATKGQTQGKTQCQTRADYHPVKRHSVRSFETIKRAHPGARRLASACATAAGTKADTSPPRPAICRTNVALM